MRFANAGPMPGNRSISSTVAWSTSTRVIGESARRGDGAGESPGGRIAARGLRGRRPPGMSRSRSTAAICASMAPVATVSRLAR
jgi:hypothetical protein